MRTLPMVSLLVAVALVTSSSALSSQSQEAYAKASNTDAGDYFGWSVAASGDTVVVGAPREASKATGVNGDQSDDSGVTTGAAYVFVRSSGGGWFQQAYLKASNAEKGDNFGQSVAISGDTIVVGAYWEDSDATGVNGNESSNNASHSGAAYVFVRNGSTWTQQAYLKASNTSGGVKPDEFGWSVAISGDTVVVGAYLEDSSATGVNGDQLDDNANNSGAAYVFVRSGGTWSQEAYLKASNTDPSDSFGGSVAISGDTIVVGAAVDLAGEDSFGAGVDGDQGNGNANCGAAYVFVRNAGTWSQQAYLKATNPYSGIEFGRSVAVSGDTIAVGALKEDSKATGINGDPFNNGVPNSGAAYIYVRQGTTWSPQAYVKASNTGAGDFFGSSVSLSGDTLAVGAYREDSAATGIGGDQTDNTLLDPGGAYVFTRTAGTWSQYAYVKASNTGPQDEYGRALAVSGDTLVVGAHREDSLATGINGNQADDSGAVAGAAYLFDLEVAGPGAGPWVDLGGGTSGVAGIPALTMTGPLTPASPLTLDLVGGAPSAFTVLFLSFASAPAPFLGGVLHAYPVNVQVITFTNALGQLHLAVTFPSAPAGSQLIFQAAMVDASVPIYGASLSNGMQGTVP